MTWETHTRLEALGHDTREEHIPVPAEHSPRKETLKDGTSGILVREKDSETAWISADSAMEVRQ